MKLFISFFLIIAFSAFIWSCSDETQLPTASSQTEDPFISGDEFDAELSLEKRGVSREAEFEVTLENLTQPKPGAPPHRAFLLINYCSRRSISSSTR